MKRSREVKGITACLLVFQNDEDVLVTKKVIRSSDKELATTVLSFTAEKDVPLDCKDIRDFAYELARSIGLPSNQLPTLATVIEDVVGTGRFSFIFFLDIQPDAMTMAEQAPGEMHRIPYGTRSQLAARKRDAPSNYDSSREVGKDDSQFVLYPSAVLDRIKKGLSEVGEDGDVQLSCVLDRVIGSFRPLREELERVKKSSIRAYPIGSADVSRYSRDDLEDFHLQDPVQYTFDTQGKGVRSQSIAVLAKHFQIAEMDLHSMLYCIERFHEASLVIDDIEDASELRRDVKCAYLQFGTPLTLNAAYLCVFKMINDVPFLFTKHHDRSRQLLLNGFVSAHRGQGLDIYWREHSYCPTEEEYIDMIRGKTSTPFVMAAALFFLHSSDLRLKLARTAEFVLRCLVAVFAFCGLLWLIMAFLRPTVGPSFFEMTPSGRQDRRDEKNYSEREDWILEPALVTKELPSNTERSIAHLFDQIGVFFQIRDDYINLTSEKYWEKKGFCDDIHEKKYSFPIIRMIRSRAGRYRDLVALFESDNDLSMEQLRAGLSWIEETDALPYTKSFLMRLREDIVHTIASSGLPELDTLIMQRLTVE